MNFACFAQNVYSFAIESKAKTQKNGRGEEISLVDFFFGAISDSYEAESVTIFLLFPPFANFSTKAQQHNFSLKNR